MITVTRDGAVSLATLDRPDRRNALDAAAVDELADLCERVSGDGTRVLVLTGAGGHFCAGADITTTENRRFAAVLRDSLDRLAGLPFPTMACISGACMGLGMQLALSVDLRVADASARFAVPVARLGLLTDAPTLQRLHSAWGFGRARAMTIAGEVYGLEEGRSAGFVQREGGLADGLAWAGEIAALAPLSQLGSKIGLDIVDAGGPERADLEARFAAGFVAAWESEDLVEGRSAFAERRPPRFTGR